MNVAKKKASASSAKTKAAATQVVINDQYLSYLLPLLESARKQIDIIAFSFGLATARGQITGKGAPYEIAKNIKELKAKRPKLKIRLFIEGLRETAERNRVTADYLADSGVEVCYGSTHAKGFCVDGRYLLLGSTNLTNQSLVKNNEANLLLDDKKAAKEFTRYFDHLWEGGKHGEITLSAPLLADGAFKDKIIDMINMAKKEIEFSIYFFNHREIEKAIIKAHQRGVNVVGFIHQHRSFAYPYVRANRATVKRLRSAGLEQLYLSVPHTFSHSKYLLVDKKEVALGTGNWLEQDVFIHPQLYLHLNDAKVARSLSRHLHWQIEHQATAD